ncbi:hypothetical protein LMANV2_260035 [Leptospira interrogans serovar Manilae]|uniref:Uncharacterized protein n=1 Tax=Leptospira interrogans serovar Manilae TaxID=214675 RepID=A0AAQ1NWM8_LEPIR|nr:hypothetical protein LMANV2_260035 [Leptospira interrogans serovar Manilae]
MLIATMKFFNNSIHFDCYQFFHNFRLSKFILKVLLSQMNQITSLFIFYIH